MAKTNGKPNNAQSAMTSLSQGDAAWLLNRPPSWLRERAHLFQRKDGRYDARQMLASLQQDYQSVRLGNEPLEISRQFAEDVMVTSNQNAADFLESVEQQHGAAGLAAVAEQLLAELRNRGDREELIVPTDDEIKTRIEREVENQAKRVSRARYKCLVICESCSAFRWGDEWRTDTIPRGYVIGDQDICPKCERKLRRRKRSLEDV